MCAYDDDKLVGMGRIVGDDAMVYVISNIMVKKEYHNRGIGFEVVSLLMNYLDENCGENALVMLMARKGTEEFYKKFGFICRPSQDGGYGMCKYY
ncbi:GNAT family N-acetyltransferase [Clostridium sp. DL1XJH146]